MINSKQLVMGAQSNLAPAITTNGKSYFLAWTGLNGALGWICCPAKKGQRSYIWGPPLPVPNSVSSASPALACLNGTIWLAWKGEGTDTRIFLASLDGTTWKPHGPVPAGGSASAPATKCAPALAAVNGKLVLAWVGATSTEIWYSTSADGKNWSAEANVPGGVATTDTPALLGLGGTVYMVWKGANDNALWLSFAQLGLPGVNSWPPLQLPLSSSFQSAVGPALATNSAGALLLAWKGQGDNTLWNASCGNISGGTWSPQAELAQLETAVRPALCSQASDATEAQLAWTDASNNIWTGPLAGLASVQAYTFAIPKFHISMMRSGHCGIKDFCSDTDYVGISVKVNGLPIVAVTQGVGDQTGGDVQVNLNTPNIYIADSDEVYFHYSILNSGAGEGAANNFLKQTGLSLVNALETADNLYIKSLTDGTVGLSVLSSQEQAAFVGIQLGGIALPYLGPILGALAGWFSSSVWDFVFPNCDGPVACGLRITNGKALRAETSADPLKFFAIVDENKGIATSDDSGCGATSDYQVTWNVMAV